MRKILLFLLLPLVAYGEQQNVRISILSLLQPKQIRITLLSPATGMLHNSAGETPILAGQSFELDVSKRIKQQHSLRCVGNCTAHFEIEGKMDRSYSGPFEFHYNYNTISIVLSSPSEELIASVTASEMRGTKELEAIKAFAIVSRSFLAEGKRHPDLKSDFCDTTHCQVFQNLDSSAEIRNAVQQTQSLILTYHNQPLKAFYSKSCGGRTATFQETWGEQPKGYEFPSVSCPCSNTSSLWNTSLSFDELHRVSGLSNAKLMRTGNRILISSENRKQQFPLEIFRAKLGQAYGWKRLPGNHYDIAQTAEGYLLRGTGQGHGVGFCQTGAEILASKGLSFMEILSHYFPGSQIKTAKSP